MIFHIMTRLKLANFNGLPQAQVFLKHTKWLPIYRRVVAEVRVLVPSTGTQVVGSQHICWLGAQAYIARVFAQLEVYVVFLGHRICFTLFYSTYSVHMHAVY